MKFISYLLEEFEHERRHRIAQYNAALPIEQGGLGLHKDNTSIDRAKALGYTVKAYHGTSHDFNRFSKKHIGKHFDDPSGFFFTPSTSHMLNRDNKGKVIGTYDDGESAGAYAKNSSKNSNNPPHIMPVLLKMNNPKIVEGDTDGGSVLDLVERRNYGAGHYFRDEVLPFGHDSMVVRDTGTKIVKNGNYDGITVNNASGKDEIYAVKHPKQIRSIHAAFDPLKVHSSDILT